MSVSDEITRLQNVKSSIKTAIESKGVTVPSNTLLDSYPSLINQIGGSSWNLLYTTEVTTSTASTSEETLTTISPGESASTDDKIIWVRIRDKAGKRDGYFFGSDTMFFNSFKANGETGNLTTRLSATHAYASSNWVIQTSGSSTGYGVFASFISNSQTSTINLGDIRIRQRYNANYSKTIDGTYKIEVFALDYASGETLYK